MSYILDALQRAEAERGQGQVPSLHALPSSTRPTAPPNGPRGGRHRWVAAAALLAVVALVLWLNLDRVLAPAPTAAPVPAAAPERTPAPAPELATAPTPAAPPAPAAQPVATPSPVTGPAPRASDAAAPSPKAPRTQPAKKAVPSADPDAAPASRTVPLLAELPEALRREVPPLHITGAVYSANPGQRLLVVNNQVLTQGSQAAPGVVLEEIAPHNAVFSVNGSRFRLGH